jgi:hypothetical protein
MTSARPVLVSSVEQAATPSGQKSCSNVFEGRGRGRDAYRRTFHRPDPAAYRSAFLPRWSALVAQVFGSRDACALAMGVTLQTACNWFDGLSRPTGDKVALLAFMHPEAFGRIMGDR